MKEVWIDDIDNINIQIVALVPHKVGAQKVPLSLHSGIYSGIALESIWDVGV